MCQLHFCYFVFLGLKDSNCTTRRNVFCFTSKPFFVLEKIEVQNFKYSNFMTSSNAEAKNKEYILLNKLGSKLLSVNEIWPTCVISQKKEIIKVVYKNCNLKTSSRPFCVCKVLSKTSIGKWNLWSKLLIWDM